MRPACFDRTEKKHQREREKKNEINEFGAV